MFPVILTNIGILYLQKIHSFQWMILIYFTKSVFFSLSAIFLDPQVFVFLYCQYTIFQDFYGTCFGRFSSSSTRLSQYICNAVLLVPLLLISFTVRPPLPPLYFSPLHSPPSSHPTLRYRFRSPLPSFPPLHPPLLGLHAFIQELFPPYTPSSAHVRVAVTVIARISQISSTLDG